MCIVQVFQIMMDVYGKDDFIGEVEVDVVFYLFIVEVLYNLVFLQVMCGLFELFQINILQSCEKFYILVRIFLLLFDQYCEMMDVVLDGDFECVCVVVYVYFEFVYIMLCIFDDNEVWCVWVLCLFFFYG